MKTKDELLKITEQVMDEFGGNRLLVIFKLEKMCEEDSELLLGFAKHGAAIVDAMMEKESATIQ